LKISEVYIDKGDENARQVQGFKVFEDESEGKETQEIHKKIPEAYFNNQDENTANSFKISKKVYIDTVNENAKQIPNFKVFEDLNENNKTEKYNNKGPESYANNQGENNVNGLKISEGSKIHGDAIGSNENLNKDDKHFKVYEDQNENNATNYIRKETKETTHIVNPFKDSIAPNYENKPISKIPNVSNTIIYYNCKFY